MSKIIHVLLTGGVGSRLWPLSRQSKPKQYLDIFSGSSLFELAVKRNQKLCDSLIIVGSKSNQSLSENILTRLEIQNFQNISEAAARNTAPAIAFAAFSCDPEDILLVTPADHLIEGEEEYNRSIHKAIALAKKNYVVTFGVKPEKPETGYGYIKHMEENVLSFHEKPNAKTAEAFLEKGDYLWNSGMFCFKAGILLEELKSYNPVIFEKSQLAWNKGDKGNLEYFTSMEIPSLSIDYAVMERSNKVKVVKAEFSWSDMGSFESVYDYLKKTGHFIDVNQNMQIGENKPTFFLGVNDCIFISTRDANLVMSKKASQDVKIMYEFLEQNHPELIK